MIFVFLCNATYYGCKDLNQNLSGERVFDVWMNEWGCYSDVRVISPPRSGTSDPYCIVKVDNEVVAR